MSRISPNILVWSSALVLVTFSSVFAGPTEENLLEAWEELQKEDAKTVVFEEVAERRYKFKTKWFPFEGELCVLNVVIEKRSYDDAVEGVLEVELADLPEKFLKIHSHSYYLWARNNRLMFDGETEEWLGEEEYADRERERAEAESESSEMFDFYIDIRDIIFYVLMAGLLVFLVVAFAKALHVERHKTEILKDILEALKGKKE